jgi:hypothetical protein
MRERVTQDGGTGKKGFAKWNVTGAKERVGSSKVLVGKRAKASEK